MKTLLTIAVALLLAQVVQAQIPDPVLNPKVQNLTLREWWRADNLKYGVGGTTWLENFYHGAGVLVVSTPSGVQTWQMRFPGDTLNVFTWIGGAANLKTGDFNNDGVTDYVDTKGNIYLGRRDSMPQAPIRAITDPFEQNYVIDCDLDHFDDVLTVAKTAKNTALLIRFGSRTIANDTTSYRANFFDTARQVLDVYQIADRGYRMLVRYYPFYYDSKGNWVAKKDVYELYAIKWNTISKELDLKLLSSKVINDTALSWIAASSIHSKQDKYYRIQAERLMKEDDNYQTTRVAVYDLSDDSIKFVQSQRLDSIAEIDVMRYNLVKTASTNIILKNMSETTSYNYAMYADFQDLSVPSLKWQTLYSKISDIPSTNDNSGVRLILPENFFNGIDYEYHFRIAVLTDSTNSNVTLPADSNGVLEVYPSPNLLSKTSIILLTLPTDTRYTLGMYDLSGKYIELVRNAIVTVSPLQLSYDFTALGVPQGAYFMSVVADNRRYGVKVILQ